MNKDKLEFYSHLTVTLIGIALLAFLVFRYLFIPVLPFLIAWAVAFMLRPAAVFISGKCKLPRKIVSAALAVAAVLIGIGAVVGLATYAISELWQFLTDFAADDRLFDILAKIANPIGSLFGEGEAAAKLEEYLGETVKGAISTLITALVNVLTSIVTRVPSVLFFILITLIAAIYFAIDIDKINARVRAFLPKKMGNALVSFKNSFLHVGVKYIRSYLVIMFITFAIMLIGFLILGVENAFLVAFLVSLLDFLPLIGVGTVLVPWSIFQLLFGSPALGIGLIVLLVVNEIIRQFAEPKIIGKSLGLHPVISLLLLYVGYSVFGFAGLLLTPLASVVLNILINKDDSSKIT